MIWLNGEYLENADAALSLQDRGYHLGDGIYETMRIHKGKPLWFEEHWNRLQRSADYAFLPISFAKEEVLQVMLKMASQMEGTSSVMRMSLSRVAGQRGLAFAEGYPVNLCVMASPAPEWYPAKPLRLKLSGNPRSVGGVEWSHKAPQFLHAIREFHLAQLEGFDDFLWRDDQNLVLEASSSNIFVRIGGVLLTPPTDGSILPGICRSKILGMSGMDGLRVEECSISVQDLRDADATILCNSVRGAMPVASIGPDMGWGDASVALAGEISKYLAN